MASDVHIAEGALNDLAQASSAYLRSAMHQPVHWQRWSESAFARARAENKPVLLDIGAVWCHWCHVMARESYDNPEVARLINENFIAIKVDRDQRPDVDSRYQAAVSAISGQGGWPLTAFLTPEGKPFYGGTYFPPEDHYGRPGFKRVLLSIAQAYREKHGDVVESANSVMNAVSRAEAFTGRSADFSPEIIEKIVSSAAKLFDVEHGGFGSQPKFPHPAIMDLLIDRFSRTRADFLGTIITTTLEKMAQGGVYDQLAGGFHRYSVDERWIVPHFEKMSYDNSELLKNYLHASLFSWNNDDESTRKPDANWYPKFSVFGELAEGIIRWVNEVLSDQENGGFYASQDADYSLDDDGDYFTWTLGEVRAVLAPAESRVIELYYDVEPHGEMHHNPAKNVLWIAREFSEIAQILKKDEDEVVRIKLHAEAKMLKARADRSTPFVDKTMYVSWNAMFVSAYLEAARIVGTAWIAEDCRKFALKTLDRMLKAAWTERRGFGHRIGGPILEGSLDDQVFSVLALLDAYETTLDPRYFSAAQKTIDLAISRYGDAEGGGFFDRPSDAAPMGGLDVRRKPFQDSPTPGANSVAAIALIRMHVF